MLLTENRVAIRAFILVAVLTMARLVDAQPQPAETFTVAETHNNSPFEYQSRLISDREGFRVYRLTYPSPVVTEVPQNNTIPADYYVPKNLQPNKKYPAVICLHILNGDEQLTDLVCSVLAGRGIPALSFKLPYYGERGVSKLPEILATDPKLFVGAIVQAGEDVRRTVDLLCSREEVNPQRIGITGISLGGITAATAAGAEPRIYKASLMLAGGDLMTIIHHAREVRQLSAMIRSLPAEQRAEVERRIAAVDPLRFAPALQERAQKGRVLMINAGQDEVIPRQCTEKLAAALGIADRVAWFEGLGHYTAMAELPKAMKMTADFFAADLPGSKELVADATNPSNPEAASTENADTAAQKGPTAAQQVVSLVEQIVALVNTEPQPGHCHLLEIEYSAANTALPITGRVRFARGHKGRFALHCTLPDGFGDLTIGQCDYPWLVAGGKKVLVGTLNPATDKTMLSYVESMHLARLRMAAGVGGGIVLAPDILHGWVSIEREAVNGDGRTVILRAKDGKLPGDLRLTFAADGRTPTAAKLELAGIQAQVIFHQWQVDGPAADDMFYPSADLPRQEVDQCDLQRMFAAVANFAAEQADPVRRYAGGLPPEKIVVLARDPAGNGLLCRNQDKLILMLSGTPEQMGTAHGKLLAPAVRKMTERTVYMVGAADTLRGGDWFIEQMSEIERRTLPHIDARFLEECDALSQAAGLSQRDGRYANLFPERFHCSGVAVRGKATVGGRLLHARVLDYMRDIGLQDYALLTLFMPEGRNKWISVGYTGFIGTVSAMNEHGLAIGEMGGRGEGHWDGTPMSLLIRDIMERATTVDEAIEMFRAAPRTCEYYYVISDRSGAMRALGCTPEKVLVLAPGEQHPSLPFIPDDTVLVSGDERAKVLSQRLQENYGRIDVPRLIEIIKRPVAMRSNLHNAIFAPQTLELWFADAGRDTPACDEPYAYAHLPRLIEFYQQQINIAPQPAK